MRSIGAALVCALALSACLSSANLAGGRDDERVPDAPLEAGTTCAADLQADIGNCGACGRVCGNQANAYGLCKKGACAIGCNTGFGDCDAKPENGCEAMLATDSNHCGACGKSCGGARCAAGQCQPLAIAEVPGYVGAVSQDAADLYYSFSAGGGYTIGKLAKDGSRGHAEVVTGIAGNVATVAVTSTEVYWTKPNDAPPAAPANGAIHRAAKAAATAAAAPWIGALRLDYQDTLTLDNGNAFYATNDGASPLVSTVSRAALAGTTSVVTAQNIKGSLSSLVVDGGVAYFSANGDNNGVGRGLYRCPTSGCGSSSTPVGGTPANTYLSNIAVVGPHLYFSTNRAVARVKKDGTEYAVIGIGDSGYGNISSFATDGTRLYWTERNYLGGGNDEFFTWTCPVANCKDGRQPVAIPGEPSSILVDEKSFYIFTRTNNGTGTVTTILKVVK